MPTLNDEYLGPNDEEEDDVDIQRMDNDDSLKKGYKAKLETSSVNSNKSQGLVPK